MSLRLRKNIQCILKSTIIINSTWDVLYSLPIFAVKSRHLNFWLKLQGPARDYGYEVGAHTYTRGEINIG